MTNDADARRLKLKAQILCGDEIAMGPGKAALLDAIAGTGSISAAGRLLGMSYRRTWLLVDAMNRCWAEPLVATATGGNRGGGARVTPFGERIRGEYGELLAALGRLGAKQDGLLAMLRERPLSPGARELH